MSFDMLLAEYQAYLTGSGYTKATVVNYCRAVNYLAEYLTGRGKTKVQEITKDDLINFFAEFSLRKTYLKKNFSKRSLEKILSCIKIFFRYLTLYEYLLVNPVAELKLEFKGEPGRRGVFTQEEINLILDGLNINEPNGQRNRAILELMYSSGIRVAEVCKLNVEDVSLRERTLLVQGKFSRERFVPFSKTAARFLTLYLEGERAGQLVSLKKTSPEHQQALFLTAKGRITPGGIGKMFNKHLSRLKLKKGNRSLHSIRHATATHLLEAGADIMHVAELLGHASLETTTVYTHLDTVSKKKLYQQYHPRANQYSAEVDKAYLADLDKLLAEILPSIRD